MNFNQFVNGISKDIKNLERKYREEFPEGEFVLYKTTHGNTDEKVATFKYHMGKFTMESFNPKIKLAKDCPPMHKYYFKVKAKIPFGGQLNLKITSYTKVSKDEALKLTKTFDNASYYMCTYLLLIVFRDVCIDLEDMCLFENNFNISDTLLEENTEVKAAVEKLATAIFGSKEERYLNKVKQAINPILGYAKVSENRNGNIINIKNQKIDLESYYHPDRDAGVRMPNSIFQQVIKNPTYRNCRTPEEVMDKYRKLRGKLIKEEILETYNKCFNY